LGEFLEVFHKGTILTGKLSVIREEMEVFFDHRVILTGELSAIG
jgi:hypothetical protein